MARRPTPIVIQTPQKETTGQQLTALGQLFQTFGQIGQRGQLQQAATQAGLSPEVAQLAGTEALAKFLIGKRERESSITKIAEAAQALAGTRPEITTRPPEAPADVQVPTTPTEALTQPIELGREPVTDITQVPRLTPELAKAAATLRATGAVGPEAFAGLTGLVSPTAETSFAKIDPSKYTKESIRRFEKTGLHSDLDIKPENIASKLGGKSVFDATNDLRGEFVDLSKTFRDVRDSFARVEESAKEPSAAGDIALIFNYMKMLDPASVVRESEFATAQNAAGVPDRIRVQYNKLVKGEKLAPNTRQDFVNRAKQLFNRQNKQHENRKKTFTGLANRFGLNPQNVVIPLEDPLFVAPEISPVAPAPGAILKFDAQGNLIP
jgi:hypothetical protein